MMGLNLSRRLISGKTSSVSLSAATPFTLEGGFKGKCDTFSVVRLHFQSVCVLTDLLLGRCYHMGFLLLYQISFGNLRRYLDATATLAEGLLSHYWSAAKKGLVLRIR